MWFCNGFCCTVYRDFYCSGEELSWVKGYALWSWRIVNSDLELTSRFRQNLDYFNTFGLLDFEAFVCGNMGLGSGRFRCFGCFLMDLLCVLVKSIIVSGFWALGFGYWRPGIIDLARNIPHSCAAFFWGYLPF